MELFDVTQIALERAMSGASLRQRALSNNLANINTPGFKRSDVDFHGVLATTLERSGGNIDALHAIEFGLARETNTSVRADGSNVDLEREMAALAENSLEYEALVSVARARLEMIQSAMGRR